MTMLNETLCLFCRPADYWPVRPLPHRSALHRWRMAGVKADDGQVVKLETIRIAGKRYTSKEAVARFIEAQNATAVKKPPEPRRPSSGDILDAILYPPTKRPRKAT